ncbi:hypothetical protein AC249_AIPGENE747 [Exaiptasia diaphana]|nr:hypothetical protein AC249_AIPGENE747 [Exaiptasia diaphana]
MHSMLDKETKEEAKQKYLSRKEKETVICPPTCSEAEMATLLQESTSTPQPRQPGQTRKAPGCTKCHKPMKGHNRDECRGLMEAMQLTNN